ncbi:MAG: putative cell wall binding protein [Bacilli bacterium]|nr:putative cell wall binding protein [Bacilli bacterium]
MARKSFNKIRTAAGIASIVVLSATGIAGASDYFGDVSPDNEFAIAINWAKDHGVMNGTSATTFEPDQPVTRAQLAQVMYNLSKQGMFNTPTPSPAVPPSQNNVSISTISGFQTSLFAQGPTSKTGPDDITALNSHLFVPYQNGVGAKGEASKSGATQSTIVEYDNSGNQINSWDITGKVDGIAADPSNNRILATVNEDANSSMYIIQPDAPQSQQVQQLTYSAPLAHGGGTDAITVQNGNIYVSASAPSADANGNFTNAALYQVQIQGSSATLKSVMMGNATAMDVKTNKQVTLNLSDPDSNASVPAASPQFAGNLMLDSQGDSQLVFVQNPGASNQALQSLQLGTQVDDVTWSTSTKGTLYVVDSGDNKIYAITGNFTPGTAFAACPSDSGVAGFVGTVDLSSGVIHPFAIGLKSPKGLLFVPGN